MANKKGKSVCIYSAKGGVGKTSTVLNIAGILSQREKNVLIVDLDVTGGAIATYLNKVPEKTVFNFVEDSANKHFQKIEDYVTKYNDNISFIAAPKDPRQGTRITPSYIELLLEKCKYAFDYVLVDTNHHINEFNVNLIDYCDEVLLIMTNDMLDIKNMRNLVQVFHDANMQNFKVLLNNSIHPNKKYYSLYDIKSVIKANIDYIIDSSFHIKTIDNYVADGRIITLEKKLKMFNPKVYKAFWQIGTDIIGEDHE